MRTLTPNTIEIPQFKPSFTPKTDYLEANSTILKIFGTLFVPCFVTGGILITNRWAQSNDQLSSRF